MSINATDNNQKMAKVTDNQRSQKVTVISCEDGNSLKVNASHHWSEKGTEHHSSSTANLIPC